jgi:hypothetical protein
MSSASTNTKSQNFAKSVRWAEICRSLHIMGHMKDFSKGECWRIAKELKKRVAAGEARKIKRGLYAVVDRKVRSARRADRRS